MSAKLTDEVSTWFKGYLISLMSIIWKENFEKRLNEKIKKHLHFTGKVLQYSMTIKQTGA